MLTKHNVPIAEHYFVNRKDTPEITQELLESMGKSQKIRGTQIIKDAKEWRQTHTPIRSVPLSPENQGEKINNNDTKNGSLNNLIEGGLDAIQPYIISKFGSAEEENSEINEEMKTSLELKGDRYKQRL